MAKDWFYAKDGERLGPISESKLRSLISEREIGPNNLVWTDGLEEWKAADDIPGLLASPQRHGEQAYKVQAQSVAPISSDLAVSANLRKLSSRPRSMFGFGQVIAFSIVLLAFFIVTVNGLRGFLGASLISPRNAKNIEIANADPNEAVAEAQAGEMESASEDQGDPSVDFSQLNFNAVALDKGPQGQSIKEDNDRLLKGFVCSQRFRYRGENGEPYQHGKEVLLYVTDELLNTEVCGGSTWVYGLKHGRDWQINPKNGQPIKEGNWVKGKRQGTHTLWVPRYGPSLKYEESEYDNGVLHGTLTEYYVTNGQKSSETPYVRGKRHGTGRLFSEDGKLIRIDYWENGKKARDSEWYTDAPNPTGASDSEDSNTTNESPHAAVDKSPLDPTQTSKEKIKTSKSNAQRAIAEWVIRVGGNLLIQEPSGADLKVAKVENLPLGSLRILKIDLTGVKEVTDGDLQKLKDAPQLVYLSVMTTSVSDEGLSHLQAIQSLEELNIAGTSITGSGFRYLSALPNLRTLNCGGSPINDESLESLSNLQLVSLGLIDTQVTTEGAKHLKTMPTLKHLRLSGTGFTDQGLKQLNRLTALETLMIDRTKVTEVGVRAFKAAVPGCSVRYTSKAGVTVNERGVANGSQVKENETSVTEPSFAGKYQVTIVNVENGRIQKSLQVEIKNDKSLLVSDGTKGEWSVRNKQLVVKAEALFGGLILTKQPDGTLVGETVYAENKMRYRMTLSPVSP
jgi:Leucine-rich repeat (LRR) protein